VTELAVTRVANSCVLLELGRHAVLTDPWFRERWHLHRGEPLGLTVADLPVLTAILGSHAFPNHWDVDAFEHYAPKDRTVVVVENARMARRARAVGFGHVVQSGDGDELMLTDDLRLEVVGDRGPAGQSSNLYVLTCGDRRVLVGGEARNVATVAAYRAAHAPVDVALLPVNGLHVPVGPRLVMNAGRPPTRRRRSTPRR
jgi:L-ascorbate metabolism protein UlaG (beta-lactamase superfamily)